MTSIRLCDFLLTGQLGPIKQGSPKEDVLQLLGHPEATAIYKISKGKRAHLCKYGNLELTINDQIIQMIQIDSPLEGHSLQLGTLTLEGYWPNSKSTSTEFIEYVEDQQLGFAIYPNLTWDRQITYVVEGRVYVAFRIRDSYQTYTMWVSNS